MPGDHPEDSVDDCVQDVMDQGHDESSAYAICEASVNDKSFDETKLASMLKEDGAGNWVDTVGRLVRNDVEKTVIADVVERARTGGSRQDAHKAMAKSDRLEKVGFEAEINSRLTVFKAGDDDFVIWGPASVEVVDKEGDKIQSKALEKALPQLLKRARLSLEHSDQLVGRILERFETNDPVKVKIGDRTFERSDFPTDVLELDKMDPALYVAGEIFNDSRQARDTRKRIEDGELDSYSISGEALVTQKKITSDGESYDDVVDLDLSAVTICEEGMNQKAKFAQIEESGETKTATAKSDDPDESGETPSVSAVANLAKSAIDETMTETDTESGNNSGKSFDPEALSAEFKSVLDSKLPDGDLATKDDMLQREDVESIAREVYDKQEDVAGEEDDSDSGTSEAEGRPGEEADVEGSEAGSPGEQKEEDVAGEEDDDDEGYSEAEGRPGDEADVEGDEAGAPGEQKEGDAREAAADLADEYGVRPGEVMDAMEALAGSAGADEEDDEKGDYEDDEMDEEEYEDKGDEEEEVPGEEEDDYVVDEEEEEEVPGDEEEEVVEAKEGYTSEELQDMLPDDVYEVVREYLSDDEEMEPGGNAEGEEGEEVMASSKEEDIESAVEKILSGKGLEKAGGASAPSGDTEKSYDEEPEPGHGNNPALSTFYG